MTDEGLKIFGKITHIGPLEERGKDGRIQFMKFALETMGSRRKPYVFQVDGHMVNTLMAFSVGDMVTVRFTIDGFYYKRKDLRGEYKQKIMNVLKAWEIEVGEG